MNLKQIASGTALVGAFICAETDTVANGSLRRLDQDLSCLPIDQTTAASPDYFDLHGIYFSPPPDALQSVLPSEVSLADSSLCDTLGVRTAPSHPDFIVSDQMRPRVDFWIKVFTSSSDVLILHHRELPWLEYARIDLAEARKTMDALQFERYRKESVSAKSQEIHLALKSLAEGNQPRNQLDRDLVQIFSQFPDAQAALKHAASQPKLVRAQRGIAELFKAGIERSSSCIEDMRQIMREHGLPAELACLPAIESAFDHEAGSWKGAAGPWQFMIPTARLHGLRVDRLIDERRDALRAAQAAAVYLGAAHAELGNWALAVTSYNHGRAGVARSVSRAGTAQIDSLITFAAKNELPNFGFASSNFFAELLAALQIFADPARYFTEIGIKPPLDFNIHTLERAQTAAEISRTLGVPQDVLQEFNPALLGPIWRGRYKIPSGYALRIPREPGLKGISMLESSSESLSAY